MTRLLPHVFHIVNEKIDVTRPHQHVLGCNSEDGRPCNCFCLCLPDVRDEGAEQSDIGFKSRDLNDIGGTCTLGALDVDLADNEWAPGHSEVNDWDPIISALESGYGADVAAATAWVQEGRS